MAIQALAEYQWPFQCHSPSHHMSCWAVAQLEAVLIGHVFISGYLGQLFDVNNETIGSFRAGEGVSSNASSCWNICSCLLHCLSHFMMVDSRMASQATFTFRTASKIVTFIA